MYTLANPGDPTHLGSSGSATGINVKKIYKILNFHNNTQ